MCKFLHLFIWVNLAAILRTPRSFINVIHVLAKCVDIGGLFGETHSILLNRMNLNLHLLYPRLIWATRPICASDFDFIVTHFAAPSIACGERRSAGPRASSHSCLFLSFLIFLHHSLSFLIFFFLSILSFLCHSFFPDFPLLFLFFFIFLFRSSLTFLNFLSLFIYFPIFLTHSLLSYFSLSFSHSFLVSLFFISFLYLFFLSRFPPFLIFFSHPFSSSFFF